MESDTAQSFRYLQIEPTTRCNFSCGFCAGRSLPQRDMSFVTFRSVIDLSENLVHVELQGEGESMLHPRFLDMVAYLRLRRPNTRISLITNGSLLTPANVEALLEADVTRILVSLETTDQHAFRAMRGGSIQQVTEGIASFTAAKKRRADRATTVGLAVTVLRRTINQIHAIGALYDELGMDGGIIVQPLQSMASYSQRYQSEMRQEIPSIMDMRTLGRRISGDPRLRPIFHTPVPGIGFYEDLFGGRPPLQPTCPWLERGLYVAADGTALTCCYIKDSQRFGLGRYSKSNLAAITHSRRGVLNTLRSGQTPDQCRHCPIARRISGMVHEAHPFGPTETVRSYL